MAASKNAGEILKTVIEDGREELSRASPGLAFSGFAAGLTITFGVVAMAVAATMTGGMGLTAMALYPIGFIIVILGRAQLFTENTVTPVIVALTNTREVPNMLRMWAVVLVFNLLGTMVFAAVVVYSGLLTAEPLDIVLSEVSSKLDYGFWTVVLKGIFGGWVVALIAWLVAASQDTVSQIISIWILTFLIPLLGLAHSVAGASEVLISVFAGKTSWMQYLVGFQIPVTIGNIIGGMVLVAILNYGQVIGSGSQVGMPTARQILGQRKGRG